MNNKYISVILLMLAVLFTSSCEDRLDIAKHGNQGSMDDYYQTDDELNSATAAMFLSMRSAYYNWYLVKNMLSDDMYTGGGGRGDNTDMERLNEYTFDTDHGMISSLYSGLYTIIYQANLIIDKTDPDDAVKKQAVAEAKAIRGYAHFELVTLWGTAPVVNHLLSSNEYRKSNSTPAELWAQVESDLTDAINSGALPSKSSTEDNETGIRVTKEFAEACLGKAYLFEGKYSEAASMLDNVINSNLYTLYTGDYDQLIHVTANMCDESMFELQLRDDTEQQWAQFTMLYIMMGWRTDKLNLGWPGVATIAYGTYGFANPRKDLYDAFVNTEGESGYRLNSTIRTYSQINQIGITMQNGVYLIGNEGYFNWKNRALYTDCVTNAPYFQALQYINLRVMRYAEVLLLASEANLQAGNQEKALKYINMVCTRAKLASLSTVTLDDIKNEKRLELCFESCRYQDLVRWGDASEYLGNQGKEIPSLVSDGTGNVSVKVNNTNTTYGFKDKNKLLPIPLKEIELNTNMVQNTGW